jgi:hypothetical protein
MLSMGKIGVQDKTCKAPIQRAVAHSGRALWSSVSRSFLERLSTAWPDNGIVNIVCHGHSVPAGYFRPPRVHTLDSYPQLLLAALKSVFPLRRHQCHCDGSWRRSFRFRRSAICGPGTLPPSGACDDRLLVERPCYWPGSCFTILDRNDRSRACRRCRSCPPDAVRSTPHLTDRRTC